MHKKYFRGYVIASSSEISILNFINILPVCIDIQFELQKERDCRCQARESVRLESIHTCTIVYILYPKSDHLPTHGGWPKMTTCVH